MLKREVFLLHILLIFINAIQCANILVILHFPGKSLHMGGMRLAEILAEKKHNVTYVSSQEINPPPESYEHVFLKRPSDIVNVDTTDYFEATRNSYIQSYEYEFMGIETAKAAFQDPKFKQLLSSKRNAFDLVILELLLADSLTYIAEYFEAPLMLYTSMDASYLINSALGNFAPPSYVPHLLSGYTSDMSFFQRVDNSLISLTAYVMRNVIGIPAHDRITKENFPGDPDVSAYQNKASVILLNSDISFIDPVPLLPGMINIGGFHVRPSKPLPLNLENIISNSKHGVIYFSLGSALKSKNLSNKTISHLLEVFSKLNQTVLWKWEADELPGKPDNVFIQKWLPQNDILAHKNVKLFITHGGMHSLLETIYHGVPCVTVPVLFDQLRNARRAQSTGFAEYIQFDDLNAENLERAVKKVLNNPSYSESAKKRSSIMHDKPLSQAETLAFWVDYVIRHKGADHLKAASLKLTWCQYFLLDVILFIVTCVILFIVILKYFLRVLLRKLIANKLKVQ